MKIRNKIGRIVLPFLALLALILFLSQWCQVEKVEMVSDSSQQFDKAVVTEVITDNLQEDGSRVGNQEVKVKFLTGKNKGKEVEAVSTNGSLYGATCYKGLKVVTLTNQSGDVTITSVYSLNREPYVIGFVLLFFVLICMVGGKNGIKAVLGLVVTFALVLFFLFPAIYRGMSPINAAIITVIFTTIITIGILTGYSKKTLAAILGTVVGVIISGVTAWAFGKIAGISGYNVSNIDTLISVANCTNIKVGDLLFAGILISSLGAVMDVGLSIASTIAELHSVKPELTWTQLFQSGMNVGKDMMGTMANTLILAFAGGSLSELLLDYAYDLPYVQLINSYTIGIEVMQGVAGSIGIILTVPLVSIFSSLLYAKVVVRRERLSEPENVIH
ncbi:MAG: YibE/F family protein [Lachnospiraceae bacterium]|nr:YibE/F family protein [Lachnospiraceae bacterium]